MLSSALGLTLSAALAGLLPTAKPAGPVASPAGLSSLPAEVKASISAALGRDQRVYHAKQVGEAWRLDNPKHGLEASFTAGGVEVRKAAARFPAETHRDGPWGAA